MSPVTFASVRRAIVVFAIAAVLASFTPTVAGQSGSFGTALTDLWWDADEPGWGVTIDNQMDVAFLTFFVYRADGSPYWVTATVTRATPGSGLTVPITFTGDLYETHGPFFAVPFDAPQVSHRKVGTVTLTASTLRQATLTYTIDGNTVQKSIKRETLKYLNFRGNYLGGVSYLTSNCNASSLNGQFIADGGYLTITHDGSSIHFLASGSRLTCSFDGIYSQEGQFGRSDGTVNCSDGETGPFSMTGMQWTVAGMSAIFTAHTQYCQIDGVIGGITGDHALP